MVFFTLVTHERRQFLTDDLARECLRQAIRTVRERRPFDIFAIVLLPNHLHAVWNLPPGDSDFSTRWRRVKEEFTTSYLAGGGTEGPRSTSQVKRGERGVWQRRFFEHTIFDEADLENHVNYLHYNPVKHGYASSPVEWPFSSFHRWVKDGHYDPDWGRGEHGRLNFPAIDDASYECE